MIKDGVRRCYAILPKYASYHTSDDACFFQKTNHNTIAIIGDSHARFLYYSVAEALKSNPSQGVISFVVAGNPPLLNLRRKVISKKNNAHLAYLDAYKFILNDPKINPVIIATNPLDWYNVTTDNYVPFYNRNSSLIGMEDISDRHQKNSDIMLERGLRRTFDAIKKHNKKIIFIVDNPDFFFDPSVCAPKTYEKVLKLKKFDAKCLPLRSELEKNPIKVWFNKILEKVAKDYDNVTLFYAFDSLCDTRYCPIVKEGKMLYRDNEHLSNEGARLLTKDLLPIIFNIQ